MNEKELLLFKEYDQPQKIDAKQMLIVRLEKLLESDLNNLDTPAFKNNFADCKELYKLLNDE